MSAAVVKKLSRLTLKALVMLVLGGGLSWRQFG